MNKSYYEPIVKYHENMSTEELKKLALQFNQFRRNQIRACRRRIFDCRRDGRSVWKISEAETR